MNLAHLLQRKALEHPDRPAIHSGTRCVASHSEWADRAARVGAHMRRAGLQPGDRVVLFMHNHPRYLELLFGAWLQDGEGLIYIERSAPPTTPPGCSTPVVPPAGPRA